MREKENKKAREKGGREFKLKHDKSHITTHDMLLLTFAMKTNTQVHASLTGLDHEALSLERAPSVCSNAYRNEPPMASKFLARIPALAK
jgi:hypothetical protein